MPHQPWDEWVEERLEGLRSHELLRTLEPLTPVDALHARREGRTLTIFSSNDYLGLSSHPEVVTAAREVVGEHGNGPRGSPLVCGYTSEHAALERELAALKETETALLFPTGFAANVSVLASLGAEGVTIFSDELNHASIIDGCRLAQKNGARLSIYHHRDMEHLASLLDADDAPRKLIVTDTVFSMDGDLAPLADLVELAEAHGAWTVVDEAHATLVYGEHGGGVAEHFDVARCVDVHVGTLSKAFGCQGGFVATSDRVRRFLLNRGRPYVFSTALPLPTVTAARAALRVARSGELRQRVFDYVRQLAQALRVDAEGPIVPVVIGSERAALDAADQLLREGMLVPAIRPPTIPAGTSRLRVTLSAGHQPGEIDRLVKTLETIR